MSKNFMIYNKTTENAVKEYGYIRGFETMQGAKTAIAAIVRKTTTKSDTPETIALKKANFEAMTISHFDEWFNPMVETCNIMNPDAGVILIRKSEKGGCTDPGTERYHCI